MEEKQRVFRFLGVTGRDMQSDRDKKFLVGHDITTVIDMRTEEDVKKKPSSLANIKGMTYYNFPVYEGSKVPNSVEEVPFSFLKIAEEPNMKAILNVLRMHRKELFLIALPEKIEVVLFLLFCSYLPG